MRVILIPFCSSRRTPNSNVNRAPRSLASRQLFADIAYKHALHFEFFFLSNLSGLESMARDCMRAGVSHHSPATHPCRIHASHKCAPQTYKPGLPSFQISTPLPTVSRTFLVCVTFLFTAARSTSSLARLTSVSLSTPPRPLALKYAGLYRR